MAHIGFFYSFPHLCYFSLVVKLKFSVEIRISHHACMYCLVGSINKKKETIESIMIMTFFRNNDHEYDNLFKFIYDSTDTILFNY